MIRRCSQCGQQRVEEPLVDAAKAVHLSLRAAREASGEDDRSHYLRNVERALRRIESEVSALRAEREALLAPATAAAPVPPREVWTPPELRREPPPPEFRAFARGERVKAADPVQPKPYQLPGRRHWPVPPPQPEWPDMRDRIERMANEPAPPRNPVTPFRRPRTAGHNEACMCAECFGEAAADSVEQAAARSH
jgi:hypothetical protein